jgi:hypothetical protein
MLLQLMQFLNSIKNRANASFNGFEIFYYKYRMGVTKWMSILSKMEKIEATRWNAN